MFWRYFLPWWVLNIFSSSSKQLFSSSLQDLVKGLHSGLYPLLLNMPNFVNYYRMVIQILKYSFYWINYVIHTTAAPLNIISNVSCPPSRRWFFTMWFLRWSIWWNTFTSWICWGNEPDILCIVQYWIRPIMACIWSLFHISVVLGGCKGKC